jgi:hypothetical protein
VVIASVAVALAAALATFGIVTVRLPFPLVLAVFAGSIFSVALVNRDVG